MLDWQVLALENGELAQAYPLVRSVARVDLTCWLHFARTVMAADGGVLGVRTGRNCLYGVATFLPKANLRYERVLEAEVLAAFALGRGSHAQQALRVKLREIAVAHGCRAVAYATETAGEGENLSIRLELVAAPSGSRPVPPRPGY